jgi:anti-sigma regulatory factor (Ser/Thr protein kinase)
VTARPGVERPTRAATAVAWTKKLPSNLTGEASIQLRPDSSGDHLYLDATDVRCFDAVAVATLAGWRGRAEAEGSNLTIIAPADPATCRRLSLALGVATPESEESVVLSARAVTTELDVKAVAAALGAGLRNRVPETLANMAVLAAAVLADNAATHARDKSAVAAATFGDRELTVCVRDCGRDLTPEEAHRELVERIQLPLASDAAAWGSSAGIAWIAHLIDRHGLEAELLFASGTGRLHVGKTAFCERQAPVEGFVALAKFAVY